MDEDEMSWPTTTKEREAELKKKSAVYAHTIKDCNRQLTELSAY